MHFISSKLICSPTLVFPALARHPVKRYANQLWCEQQKNGYSKCFHLLLHLELWKHNSPVEHGLLLFVCMLFCLCLALVSTCLLTCVLGLVVQRRSDTQSVALEAMSVHCRAGWARYADKAKTPAAPAASYVQMNSPASLRVLLLGLTVSSLFTGINNDLNGRGLH